MPWKPDIFPIEVNETIELGRKLSLILDCSIRLVSWAKPQYECWHNVIFPRFAVKGCLDSGNIQLLIERHKQFTEQSGLVKDLSSLTAEPKSVPDS